MAKTRGGLTRAVPHNSLSGKRIFTMATDIKIEKVNGWYQYQSLSLKFTCTRVLDQNFPHLQDNRLYFNMQACLDNLLDEVEWKVNWEILEGSSFKSMN